MKLNLEIWIRLFFRTIILLIGFVLFRNNQISISAITDVSKYNLPYEITSMSVENNELLIKGWAFIAYQQHYLSVQTHATQFSFTSSSDVFTIDAELTNYSQTLMMEYFGSPTCTLDSINKNPETCNFSYEYVGFIARIPLDRFKTGHTYQSKIISNALNANLSYQTDVYFPMSTDLTLQDTSKRLTIISRLDDTILTINSTTVLARKEASKTGATWFYGTNCSTSYLNQLYFLKNTVYKNVYEKIIVDDTSFYRLKANLYLCNLYRRRIIEGQMFDPVWIASPYVSYSGSPLTIFVESVNQAPVLTTRDVEIYENETINLLDYVSAYDLEDGDISSKIELIETNYQYKIGSYYALFRVSDSYGLTDTKSLNIHIKEIPNFIPTIVTESIKLLQYSYYDAKDHATASDFEDGDITDKIIVLNVIDTNTLGQQDQCYGVSDTKGAYFEACMTVDIISYKTYSNMFRFVSTNNAFVSEPIPELWILKTYQLTDLINSNLVISSSKLD